MPSNKQQGTENTLTPEEFDSIIESLNPDDILPDELALIYANTLDTLQIFPISSLDNNAATESQSNNNNSQAQIESPSSLVHLSSAKTNPETPADHSTPYAWFKNTRPPKDADIKTSSQHLSRYNNIYISLENETEDKSNSYINPTLITDPSIIDQLDQMASNKLQYKTNKVTTYKQFKDCYTFLCLIKNSQDTYTPQPKLSRLITFCETTKRIFYNNDLIIKAARIPENRNNNKKKRTAQFYQGKSTLFQPAALQSNVAAPSPNSSVTPENLISQLDEQTKRLQMLLCNLDPHQTSPEIKQMLSHAHAIRMSSQAYQEKKAKLTHPTILN